MNGRSRQIRRAYRRLMRNPPVLVGIDLDTVDHSFEFVELNELEEWKQKYGDRLKVLDWKWNKSIIVF